MTKEEWFDLAAKIDNEGMDYYFCHYIHPDDIEDPKLKELAIKYVDASSLLQEYLDSFREKYGDYDEEEE